MRMIFFFFFFFLWEMGNVWMKAPHSCPWWPAKAMLFRGGFCQKGINEATLVGDAVVELKMLVLFIDFITLLYFTCPPGNCGMQSIGIRSFLGLKMEQFSTFFCFF